MVPLEIGVITNTFNTSVTVDGLSPFTMSYPPSVMESPGTVPDLPFINICPALSVVSYSLSWKCMNS